MDTSIDAPEQIAVGWASACMNYSSFVHSEGFAPLNQCPVARIPDLFALSTSKDSAFLELSTDMGFSVKCNGNFLQRNLSMKKDSSSLKAFSSEPCLACFLPHPFFLRVHILGYSINRSTVTDFRKKETTAKRQPSCENPYIKRSGGSNLIVALYQNWW